MTAFCKTPVLQQLYLPRSTYTKENAIEFVTVTRSLSHRTSQAAEGLSNGRVVLLCG